jgi:hypothetical protein
MEPDARPDPTTESSVRGQVTAQAEMAKHLRDGADRKCQLGSVVPAVFHPALSLLTHHGSVMGPVCVEMHRVDSDPLAAANETSPFDISGVLSPSNEEHSKRHVTF